MKAILVATLLAACAVPDDVDGEPDLDGGKADGGAAPIAEGMLGFDAPREVVFPAGAAGSLAYVTFELSGNARVALAAPDARLYVYRPDGDVWGRALAHGTGKLTASLHEGLYRALVIRKGTEAAQVALTATCSGAGCTPPLRGCTPREPRTVPPDVFVGPTQWQTSIAAAIDRATVALDVQMYLFTVTAIADRIVAARDRGVAVRVLLDPDEPNGTVVDRLTKAGIEVRFDPAAFAFAHAKYMVIDHAEAVVLSGNFNAGAMSSERNYAIVDRDPDDVADVVAIFESDWSGGPAPDLACTRLVVSPVNAGQRIIAHVTGATRTLDLELLYLDEPQLQAAVIAAAGRGVAVRVMLSDPAKNPQNTDTQAKLLAAGVPTKLLLANYLHAKMILADGVAHIGSENMSATSWTKNREVGAQVFEPAAAAVVRDQFDADWAIAVDHP